MEAEEPAEPEPLEPEPAEPDQQLDQPWPVAVGNRFGVSDHQADSVWPFRTNLCPPLI